MAIPQTIQDLAKKVRNSIFGKDVRESIAQSMEETGETAQVAKETAAAQIERVDRIIANAGNDNTEIVDARGGETILGNRLNKIDANMAQNTKKIDATTNKGLAYAVLLGFKGDGEFDNSSIIKDIIDNHPEIEKIKFPSGEFWFSKNIDIHRMMTLEGTHSSRQSSTIFKLTSNSVDDDIVHVRQSSVKIVGINFEDGNKQKTGIRVVYNSNMNRTAHNLHVKDCQFNGLKIGVFGELGCSVNIDHCRFEWGYQAIVTTNASNVWHINDTSFWYFQDTTAGSCVINAQHSNAMSIDNCWGEHNRVPFLHISDFGQVTSLKIESTWVEHLGENTEPVITSDKTVRWGTLSIKNSHLYTHSTTIIDVHNINQFDIDNTRIFSSQTSNPIINLNETNLATIGTIETHSVEFGEMSLSRGEHRVLGGKQVIYKNEKKTDYSPVTTYNMRNDSSFKDSTLTQIQKLNGNGIGTHDNSQGMYDNNSFKMFFASDDISTFVEGQRNKIFVEVGKTVFASFYAWSVEPNVIRVNLSTNSSELSTGYIPFLVDKKPRRFTLKLKIPFGTSEERAYLYFQNYPTSKSYDIWIDDIQYSNVPTDLADEVTEIPYVMNNFKTEGVYTSIKKGHNLSEHYHQGKLRSVNTDIPTAGNYSVGDIIYDASPTIGGHVGWICVESGSPGVWKGFGLIDA